MIYSKKEPCAQGCPLSPVRSPACSALSMSIRSSWSSKPAPSSALYPPLLCPRVCTPCPFPPLRPLLPFPPLSPLFPFPPLFPLLPPSPFPVPFPFLPFPFLPPAPFPPLNAPPSLLSSWVTASASVESSSDLLIADASTPRARTEALSSKIFTLPLTRREPTSRAPGVASLGLPAPTRWCFMGCCATCRSCSDLRK